MRGLFSVKRLLRWKDRHVNKVKPARIGHPAVQLRAFDTYSVQNGHGHVDTVITDAKVESLRELGGFDRLEAEFRDLVVSFPDPNPQVVAYAQWKLEKGFKELFRDFGDLTVVVVVRVEEKSMVAYWGVWSPRK